VDRSKRTAPDAAMGQSPRKGMRPGHAISDLFGR
jgi:hypothetical protein